MPVLRLFLDANVLFLAGYSHTSPVHDLLTLGRAGACELVASGYAVEEAQREGRLLHGRELVSQLIQAVKLP